MDATDYVIDLPLFPLNVVLFPGMPLPLHIFEERYRLMINECIDSRQPFGVVLIKSGQEAGGTAEPHMVGCTAEIVSVQRLEDGRLYINTVGRDRFKIHELHHDKQYLHGTVEILSMEDSDTMKMIKKTYSLRRLVRSYLDTISSIADTDIDPEKLPEEPMSLAYLGTILLQVPAEIKQRILGINSVAELMSEMHNVYQRENALLVEMLRIGPKMQSQSRNLN